MTQARGLLRNHVALGIRTPSRTQARGLLRNHVALGRRHLARPEPVLPPAGGSGLEMLGVSPAGLTGKTRRAPPGKGVSHKMCKGVSPAAEKLPGLGVSPPAVPAGAGQAQRPILVGSLLLPRRGRATSAVLRCGHLRRPSRVCHAALSPLTGRVKARRLPVKLSDSSHPWLWKGPALVTMDSLAVP